MTTLNEMVSALDASQLSLRRDEPTMHRKHKGAHSELVACAWLLRQGYEVFRAVSPHGVIDLVAIKDGVAEYFDVKTLDWSARLPPYAELEAVKLGVKYLIIRPDGSIEIHNSRSYSECVPSPLIRPVRPMLNCQRCGTPFEVYWNRRRFCSNDCRGKWGRGPHKVELSGPTFAETAGAVFPPPAASSHEKTGD
jgi:hypothetical protein